MDWLGHPIVSDTMYGGKLIYPWQIEDKEPVGCVAMVKSENGTFFLEKLAVLPDKQRKGYGKNLVDHVMKKVKNLSGKNSKEKAIYIKIH